MSVETETQIARLRDLIRNARSMPMSASAVINRAEVLELIDSIQAGLQEATSESSALMASRERVIAEGEATAKETIRLAELERDHRVSDTEVFRLASREAERVRAEAVTESEQLRRDADDYIEQRFANFEHSLDKTLSEVRRGIANLSGRSAFGDADGEPGERYSGSHSSGADDVLPSTPDAG